MGHVVRHLQLVFVQKERRRIDQPRRSEDRYRPGYLKLSIREFNFVFFLWTFILCGSLSVDKDQWARAISVYLLPFRKHLFLFWFRWYDSDKNKLMIDSKCSCYKTLFSFLTSLEESLTDWKANARRYKLEMI